MNRLLKLSLLASLLFSFLVVQGQEKEEANNVQDNLLKNSKGLYRALSIPRVEYTYFNQSYLTIGAKFPIAKKHDSALNDIYIGAKANLGISEEKFAFAPEIDVTKNIYYHKHYWAVIGVGAGISPYYFYPKLDLNVATLNVELGYNFEFKQPDDFDTKGFRFSVGFDLY